LFKIFIHDEDLNLFFEWDKPKRQWR